MPRKTNFDVVKLHYEALIAEYQTLRQSIVSSREMQGQSDNIALAALGVSIPIILTILNQSMNLVGLILFIPILFFVIVFTQLRHDRMLLLTALYIDFELRPRVEKLLNSISSEDVKVFQWEGYFAKRPRKPNLMWEFAVIFTHISIGLVAGLSILGVYIFIRFSNVSTFVFYSYEGLLLAINVIMIIVDLYRGFRVASLRTEHLMKYHELK